MTLRRGAEHAAGVVLLALWTAAAWAGLHADAHDALVRRGVIAFAAALVVARFVPGVATWLRRAVLALPPRVFVGLMALASVALGVWLWRGAMRGQVISGDACIYVLQGRGLAHGDLALPVTAPRAASSVKFLIEGRDGRFHGVFVPGYPLYLAPFLRLGVPWLSGVLLGAAMTVGQYLLAKRISADEFAARASLLLVAPTYQRAIETTDLLSHAFVGTLATFAVVLALSLRSGPTLRRAVLLGVLGGWVFSARMLDGFVLSSVIALCLGGEVVARRLPLRLVLAGVLAAAPFAALVARQQYVCTGNARTATAIEYANRSDHPRGCLRLGFGREIGCRLEHPGESASFGADGYTPDDAFRLISERTGRFGDENFGAGWLCVLAFIALAMRPSTEALVTAAFPVGLTFAYGLFYYGNGIVHGARHLFPAMPFVAVLAARAIAEAGRRDDRWRGALLAGSVALLAVALPPAWREGLRKVHRMQDPRIALRRLLAREHIDHGIVLTPDVHSYLEALDPWTDGTRLLLVYSDNAGEVDLRRFHPTLPVFMVVNERTVLRVGSSAPGPGLRLEMERAWPSLQRPDHLSAGIIHTLECCAIFTSGLRGLRVFAVERGGRLAVPFDMAYPGRYRFRMRGAGAPDQGRFTMTVDRHPLPPWDGYLAMPRTLDGPWSEPVEVSAGRHWLVLRENGRDPRATDGSAVFDVFEAEPADVP